VVVGFRIQRHPAVVVIVALASLALTGTSSGQAGQPISVSPTEGMAFTQVSVSGGGCLKGPSSVVGGRLFAPNGAESSVVIDTTPNSAGNWTTTFTVPPDLPAGQYTIRATCRQNPNDPGGDAYQPGPFRILQSPRPVFRVSPTQATAGQAVVLSVSGTLCRGAQAEVDAGVFALGTEEADEFVDRRSFTPDAQGNWSGQLTMPASASPGRYRTFAGCNIGGRQLFIYPDKPSVVLSARGARPAVAVPARPSFTG
jgi:hypothetical protein